MIRLVLFLTALFWTLPARAEIQIQQVTSPGGISAWLVEEHSLPFMALEIRFRGGASLDAPGKRGAINLMTALIEEGAGDLDARGFAEAREALAASYNFDVGDDTLSISARFLTENRDAAVALLRLALTQPRFDPDAIERVRGQVLSNLRSRETEPNALASRAFDALTYGDHPYASYYGGTAQSAAALTRDDILEAFGRAIARDRIHVSAVGDITPDELGGLMDQLFAALPKTGAPMPERVDFAAPGGIELVPFDTPQSVARFGHIGIERHDPDFFAAYVINEILGGSGFNSRLMDEVREKRGLTYGIGTYLMPMEQSESIMGHFASANARMAEAIQVVQDEWARISNEGVTPDELEAAKTYLTGAYPLRFDGNGTIADILVGMQLQNLPIDYIATRNDRINAVTLEEANRVAARIYRPDALQFVVVGMPDGVQTE